jgi:mRNA interferase MazF
MLHEQSVANISARQHFLVPFPFTDLSRQKTRPAVVISSASYNTRMSDLILVAISSKTTSIDSAFDLLIPSTHPLFAATGLRTPSIIRTGKIVTIAQEMIYRKLGNLPTDLMTRLEQRLWTIFDLNSK